MTRIISPAATIAAHVDQLRASERGRQTLADLHRLLDNGGGGLDASNQRALAGLLSAAFRDRLRNTLLDLAHLAAADLKPGAGWEERLWLYERHVRRSAAAALAATAGAAARAETLHTQP